MNSTFQKGAANALSYPLQESPEDPGQLVDPRKGVRGYTTRPIYPFEKDWNWQVDQFKSCREDVTSGRFATDYLSSCVSHYHSEGQQPYSDLLIDAAQIHGLPDFYTTSGFSLNTPLVDVDDLARSCARLVRMDDPDDLAVYLFKYIWFVMLNAPGTNFLKQLCAFKHDVGPVLTKSYEHFMPAKYYWGLVRPEEYFNLPGCVVTEYPEGCPTHPAYPAGHGTFAGMIARFLVEWFKLEGEAAGLVYYICWLFAHFRTFAGVHWPQDNEAGFSLGYRAYGDLD